MEAWKRLGSLIAHNMVVIVPVGLALGIAFPQAFGWIRPLVAPLFAFVTFQGSLANDFRNLAETFRHPVPMVAAIVVSQVLAPVLAWALGSLFFSDHDLVCGLILEYTVPIAVTSTMWVGIYEGNMALALGTLLISTVLSPVTIPATLQVLMGTTVEVDAAGMIRDMLLMVAIPALVGTALNDRTQGWAKESLSPALSPLARILVVVIITTNSTSLHDFVLHLTPQLVGVMLVVLVMIVSCYALGFAASRLLRLDRASSVTLTFCSALKNISSGAVIAQTYFPAATMFPVMTGTLFNQVLASVMGRLLGRLLSRDTPTSTEASHDNHANGHAKIFR